MRRLALLTLVAVVGVLCACKIATIRPIGSKESGNDIQEFDAVTHAGALWADELPQALEQAVDLAELLPAVARDAGAAGARWGRREGTGPYHVIVRGQGRVLEADIASRTGTAVVEIATADGPARVRLQVGPVLQGTSVRDGLPGVSFDQFANQIQFADVANELNALIEREVLGDLDREALAGTQVRFAGMSVLGGSDEPLTVTPVRFDLEGDAGAGA